MKKSRHSLWHSFWQNLQLSLQQQTLWWLGLVLLFAFFTRIWHLDYPARYYFDEVYHGVTAKLIAQNDPRAYEWWHSAPEPDTAIDWLHPPLAKLTQATSMLLVGQNSFGWRLSSAIFGTGVIALTYGLARQLKFSPQVALLAAALASLDGLLLTMSRIAMNDIHVTFFMLLTWWLYWRWRETATPRLTVLTSLAAGAAVASKWSGVFVLAPILVDLIALPVQHMLWHSALPQNWLKRTGQLGVSFMIAMPLVYLLSYGQMFLQGHSWSHFVELHQQIWWYQTRLDATHPYQSLPWQWVLNWRPVYAFVDQSAIGSAQIYLQGNAIIFWSGAVAVLATIGLALAAKFQWLRFTVGAGTITTKAQLKQWQTQLGEYQLALQKQCPLWWLVVAYLSVWIAWVASPRIMFFYHYTPAVPTMSIILAYWLIILAKHRWWRWLAVGLVVLIAVNFALFYPHWTGMAVRSLWLRDLYFALPSWR